MKKEILLIDNYLYNNYENSFQINISKYELLSFLEDKLSKLNSYLEKLPKEKGGEIKKLKDKLAENKEEEKFIYLFMRINETINRTFREYYQIINKILNNIIQLKELFKPYFNAYENFINIQKNFLNKLNEVENAKNIFLETAKKAELFIYKFIKKTIYKEKIKNQNDFKYKEDLKILSKFQLEKYISKLNQVNGDLKTFNQNQKNMFTSEKELDIKYNEIFSECLMIFFEHQLIIEELINNIKTDILKINENIKKFTLQDFLEKYKPKEEIDLVKYKTNIEFDKCKDAIELSVCLMSYNELAHYIGKYEEIELLDKNRVLDLFEEINRIINLDDKITDEDNEKLIELLKNDLAQNIFINLLNLIRTSGKYEKSERFISIIGNSLNLILESIEKEKKYERAKYCIILSDTFYYLDKDKQKRYIFEVIKNNKWLKSSIFWREFIYAILKIEFENIDDLQKKNLNNKLIIKLLLSFVNNMKKFGIDVRIIIKIIDEISQKYNYLNEESYYSIFSVISSDIKKIEEYRKEYKENPNLEKDLYNYEEEKIIENEDNNNIIIEENKKNGNNKEENNK